jgi:hypothetical protein
LKSLPRTTFLRSENLPDGLPDPVRGIVETAENFSKKLKHSEISPNRN